MSGINKVRAFELPGGIWADGDTIASPRIALIRWQSQWDDKFYQVYVNGEFAGATVDSRERQMILQMPLCENRASRIEVFAVEPEDAFVDFSDESGEQAGAKGRVKIGILRTQGLPVGGTIEVYSDNGTGVVDYDEPISETAIPVWPSWQYKGGLGMSRFGYSDFGYDWSAGVGFGRGGFGNGEFGVGADVIEWISPELRKGVYKFGVKLSDMFGNECLTETEEITVVPSAQPAAGLSVYSYGSDEDNLVLEIL